MVQFAALTDSVTVHSSRAVIAQVSVSVTVHSASFGDSAFKPSVDSFGDSAFKPSFARWIRDSTFR
jgi:hypothetical protein